MISAGSADLAGEMCLDSGFQQDSLSASCKYAFEGLFVLIGLLMTQKPRVRPRDSFWGEIEPSSS